MRVLYLGHYKENSGWAEASKNQILSLDSAGVDIVCRSITLTQDRQLNGRILELEQKDSKNCDVCIQHVLPHHLIGTSRFKKNIAFIETETTSIEHLNWIEYLKQMNEVWVPNQDAAEALVSDGIDPVKVVHHACDLNKYTRKYNDINIPPAEGKFKFYYVGDINDRKNLETIVTCFHSEFDRTDNVALILKINKFGKSPEEIKASFDKWLLDVKTSLRMYPSIDDYIKDITIIGNIPDDAVNSIHQYCDCFLCPSHGEAWSIPAFDAMAFGNRPICSDFGGPPEYIDKFNENTGKLIEGVFKSCKCSDAAFPDIFTGREYWFEPCERKIRWQMRKCYEEYQKDPLKFKREGKIAGLNNAKQFSYQAVGKAMKDLLDE